MAVCAAFAHMSGMKTMDTALRRSISRSVCCATARARDVDQGRARSRSEGRERTFGHVQRREGQIVGLQDGQLFERGQQPPLHDRLRARAIADGYCDSQHPGTAARTTWSTTSCR
jgi:hypothetical protein